MQLSASTAETANTAPSCRKKNVAVPPDTPGAAATLHLHRRRLAVLPRQLKVPVSKQTQTSPLSRTNLALDTGPRLDATSSLTTSVTSSHWRQSPLQAVPLPRRRPALTKRRQRARIIRSTSAGAADHHLSRLRQSQPWLQRFLHLNLRSLCVLTSLFEDTLASKLQCKLTCSNALCSCQVNFTVSK